MYIVAWKQRDIASSNTAYTHYVQIDTQKGVELCVDSLLTDAEKLRCIEIVVGEVKTAHIRALDSLWTKFEYEKDGKNNAN